MADGNDEIKRLQRAGFTQEEIGQWQADESKRLVNAGFSMGDVDSFFGRRPFKEEPVKSVMLKNIKSTFEQAADAANAKAPKKAVGLMDALEAGWQMSVSGLVARGGAPDKALGKDAKIQERVASSLAGLAGDVPAMIGGALLGAGTLAPTGPGAVAGAVGGAFALPAGLRAVLMDAYTNSEVTDFKDFWNRASYAMLETAKGYVTGAATAGAGMAAKAVLPAVAPAALRLGVPTAAEIATMTTVGAALEGHVPTAMDFIDAAIVVGGMKAAGPVSRKLRDVYSRTGLKPGEVVERAQTDPVLKQDLLSRDVTNLYESEVLGVNRFSSEDLAASKERAAASEATNKQRVAALLQPSAQMMPGTVVQWAGNAALAAQQKQQATPAAPAGGGQGPVAAILARIAPERKDGSDVSFSKFYAATVDDLHPIKELQTLLESPGQQLAADKRPYDLARLTRGAFGKADQFLEHATFEYDTLKNNGKSLKEAMAPVEAAKDLDGFRAYALSARALELNGRGIETGIPLAEAKQVVAAGKTKYHTVFKDVVGFQNRLTQYLRDSGVISKEQYDAMLDANKNFVPFYRLMGDEFGGPGGAGKGFSVRNPIKKITGSESLIVDPIESIIKNTYLYVTLAERNGVGGALGQMIEKNPGAAAALGIEKVPTPVRPIEVKSEELDKFMADHGLPPQGEAMTIFRAMRQPVAKDEIRFFENGKPVTFKVPEEVAKAFQGMDSKTFGLFTQIIAYPAKLLRAGTTLSPEFMSRNFTRDQMSAFILTVGGFKPVWDTLRGMGSLLTKDEHYQNWLKSGGANSAFVSIDRKYLQENVFKLSHETGLIDRAINVVRSPLELLRTISETIENSTRLGEFKQVSEGATSKADLLEAGMSSREVTLDFQRVGSQTRALNMMSAFFNPGVQGVDRIIRAFHDRPGATTAKTLLAVTLPSVLLWTVNHDDPRWKDIPNWQKDLFWIVMTKDTIYRIPKPFELGIIFGSLPERVLEAYFTENPHAFSQFRKSVVEGFVPNYLPTFATPIIEQFANRSTFTGNPLVPAHLEGLLPEYRYTEYTSETAKVLGHMLGALPGMKHTDMKASVSSPAVIDNYVRAWTGQMGTYAFQIADKALIATGAVPDPVKPAATLADLPVIKAFVVRYPSATAQSVQDFYDRYYERKQTYDTVLALASEGNADAARKELALEPNAMANLDGMREALTNISKVIRLVSKNPDYKPDEKRQLIDTMYFQMIEIAHAGNSTLDTIDKTLGVKPGK